MSLNRYAKRRDISEPDIITALERVGALIERMDRPCDLLVRFRGVIYLLEVKTDRSTKEGGKHKGSDEQRAFCSTWNVPMVKTAEEALRVIGAIGPREVDFNVSPIYASVI